jgi:DNA-binding response OmpR family regulator
MPKTILYAEDEQWLLDGIRDGLTAMGYQVVPASDGSQALEMVRTRQFDLLLLDIMMPPGNLINEGDAAYGRRTGVEVCKIVRKEQPQLPIICLTVVMDRQIHAELRKLGAVILEKPAVPSEIVARVRSIIGA